MSTSPISAADVAAGSRPIDRARFSSDGIVFSQRRPDGPKTGLYLKTDDGEVRSLLPGYFSVRSRVHEYGGGSWDIDDHGAIVFVGEKHQRLYAFYPGHEPEPMTPDTDGRVRFGDITAHGSVFTAVREEHGEHPQDVQRNLVLIEPHSQRHIRSLFPPDTPEDERPHFMAYPRISPDSKHLAFIGWNHPNMPWDSTQLWLVDLDPTSLNPISTPMPIMGAEGESILQPEWRDSSTLLVSTDASGSWKVVSLDAVALRDRALGTPGAPAMETLSVLADEGEIGGPLWSLGTRWYLPVHGGQRILAAAARDGIASERTVGVLWADSSPDMEGSQPVDFGLDIDWAEIEDFRGQTALIRAGGRNRIDGLYSFDIGSGDLRAEALTAELPCSAEYIPWAEVREYSGVQAIFYPPRTADSGGSAGSPAPCVAFVHGGPTSRAVPRVSLHHAYFTSRGIAVVDVNYRGSTGLGRAYRDALKGQWGRLDVEDTVTVIRGLADAGDIDPERVAISGGSAGGFTALMALATTDAFACGSSYYGVVDMAALAEDTHDFESHYVEGLIGAPAADAEAFRAASPISHLESLSTPVAVFQGDKDAVVPPNQARGLIDALEKADLPYAARFFPEEGHVFADPEAIRASLEDELSFYGRIMGFDVDAPPVRLRGRGR